MTPDFDARKDSRHISSGDSKDARDIDILQRDRFELLSAYVDGEVTAAERKQVQQLLNTDSQTQHLYARIMKLRHGIQTLPIPQSEQPAEIMVKEVFSRIEQRRTIRNVVWGGAAIAALFIGALPNVFSGSQSPAPKLAASPVKPVMVAVRLDRPAFPIPKAAMAKPSVAGDNNNNNTAP